MKVIDAFISKNAAKLLWLAAGILIAFIFLQQCNGRKQSDAFKLLQAQLNDTKKEKQKIAFSLDSIFKKHAADSATWAGEKQLAVIETKEADVKVKQQQKRIDQLIAVIRNEPEKPDSSTMVLVTPAFKEACDSLPNEIDKLNRAIAEKDTAINEWSGLLAHEVQERDNTIEALRVEVDKLDKLNKRTEIIASKAIALAEPRGRFMGGVSVMGNQQQFVTGAGPVFAYLTKGGKQYQAAAKFIKVPGSEAEVYYEGSVLFTIFK